MLEEFYNISCTVFITVEFEEMYAIASVIECGSYCVQDIPFLLQDFSIWGFINNESCEVYENPIMYFYNSNCPL